MAESLIIPVTLVGLKVARLCLKGDGTAAELGIPRCLAQTHTVQGLDSFTQFSLNVTGCLIGRTNCADLVFLLASAL